jgi:hypothetical protein
LIDEVGLTEQVALELSLFRQRPAGH